MLITTGQLKIPLDVGVKKLNEINTEAPLKMMIKKERNEYLSDGNAKTTTSTTHLNHIHIHNTSSIILYTAKQTIHVKYLFC